MNSNDLITCTSRSLTLERAVDELPDDLRDAVVAWLSEHDIDAQRVAVGTVVERHEESQSVSWRERTERGMVVHQSFPAVGRDELWPAPFPAVLGCGETEAAFAAPPGRRG